MKSTFRSIGFIASFMKRYTVKLILVVFFIVLTTYLNIHAPKIMGDAIDKMVSPFTVSVECGDALCDEDVDGYVIEAIKYDTMKEMVESIEAGNGIPDDIREQLEANNNEDMSNLLEMSNEDLKTTYDFIIEFKRIVDINDDALKNGFDDEQIAAIKDSSVFTEQQKQAYTITDQDYIDALVASGMDKTAATTVMSDPEKNLPAAQYQAYQAQKELSSPESISTNYEMAESFAMDETKKELAFESFTTAVILLVIAYVLNAVTYFMYSFLMARVSADTVRDMRIGLFHKIEELSIRFFDRTTDGDLLSRFVNDMDNISNALTQSFTQAISQVAMLIGIIYMMFNEDNTSIELSNGMVVENVLAWIMIIFAVVAIIAASIVVLKAQKYVSIQQEKLGNLNGYVDEQLSGQKTVIAYGLQKESNDGFDIVNEDLRATSFKGQMYSNLLMPMVNGIGFINLGMIVFAGSMFIIEGSSVVSVGLIVAFIQYSQRFFQPLATIFSQYNILQLGITGGGRVKEIFDVEAEVTNRDKTVDITGINGQVHIDNVTFGYDEDMPVLKNVDILVEKGQMVALVGPTGSGKTTVMNLMNRFYDVNSGAIYVDGKDIRDLSISSLRSNVGIVLQESIIFSGTIFDNIAYGKENATLEEVISAAKMANIHEFISHLENGYDTKIDNDSSIFSVGQKQMMSIARTILTDPDLLILDEATSNVDTVTEEKIQMAMKNALENRTSFVIAHRLKTILNADIIVVLKDGEVIEKGSHRELLKADGFYAELYHNQFVVE